MFKQSTMVIGDILKMLSVEKGANLTAEDINPPCTTENKKKPKKSTQKRRKIIRKTRTKRYKSKKGKGKDYLKLPVLLGLWCLWHDHIRYMEQASRVESILSCHSKTMLFIRWFEALKKLKKKNDLQWYLFIFERRQATAHSTTHSMHIHIIISHDGNKVNKW